MKETAVVICPGRGTYNKSELGYLQRYHPDKKAFLESLDAYRKHQGQMPVTELDQQPSFKPSLHTTGDNASPLIYACALADFADIDKDRFDIVGVTGNSMGWYLALACAGALSPDAGIHLVNTMGTLMHKQASGGQVIYPLVNEQWQPDPWLQQALDTAVSQVALEAGVFVDYSIHLGGMAVLAANDEGIRLLLETLPPVQDLYPFALPNHGAFHSGLMGEISGVARQMLPSNLFTAPDIRLIDGRGRIWHPEATDVDSLYSYTLEHQILCCYDFSKSIEVSVKEMAPDRLIILGPGTTLGAPTAQELIRHNWLGLSCKDDFRARQQADPFVLSMGYDDQRQICLQC